MKIRRAEKKDLADVARIHVEAWKSVYRGIMPDEVLDARNLDAQQIVWEEELDKGSKLYVCEQEGNIVFLSVFTIKHRKYEHYNQILLINT